MSGMGEDSALYFGFGMATRPRAALAPGDDYCAETLTIGVLSLEGRSKIELLEFAWPSGQVDRLKDVPADKIIAVREGTGIVPRSFPVAAGR